MRAYVPRLRALTRHVSSFTEQRRIFLDDRFGATHFLKPVLDGDPDAFFTNGDDMKLQRAWARENGLKADASLEDILLAQIEAHRTEVFYNHDPVRYPSSFVRRLPGCVKRKIAWRAAPSGNSDFGAYDLMVCNFPSILEEYRTRGWHGTYFTPAHDPEMDAYAGNEERPIDVLFVGGYSRHHWNRAAILERVAKLRYTHKIVYHLDSSSRFQRLAESPLGLLGPLKKHRRPAEIRAIDAPPVFGRDLYKALSQAKIVLNGAIDMSGIDRGNMRCWESMGCGALLISDVGNYPEGMAAGKTMETYNSAADVISIIEGFLNEPTRLVQIACYGHQMIRKEYSKERQWQRFSELL
ncbi:MAG: glycosyltransferase [Pseudorhodoplanes sp.]